MSAETTEQFDQGQADRERFGFLVNPDLTYRRIVFDEDTARELQSRAQEYLGKIEGELDAKRTELGVEDAVKEVPGVTTAMLVKLGENGVKSVEDLAGCATDDLVGYTEGRGPEATKHAGYLDGFEVSRAEAEGMIMAARLHAGWIDALPEPEVAEDEAAPAA